MAPGIITGAADNDPSGIPPTRRGSLFWVYDSLDCTPFISLIAAVQFMCAKLGMVTGCGLASVIRTHYPRWVLWLACSLVTIANIFNIGADLGSMADAMHMMTGVPAFYWAPIFAAAIVALLFWTSYRLMARVFMWLTLVLFAYVIAAFLAHPDWRAVLHLDFAGLNAVKMLFWSAILNGLLAPPLVVMVVLLTSDKKVMRIRTNTRGMKGLGWTCAIITTAAAVGLLISSV